MMDNDNELRDRREGGNYIIITLIHPYLTFCQAISNDRHISDIRTAITMRQKMKHVIDM